MSSTPKRTAKHAVLPLAACAAAAALTALAAPPAAAQERATQIVIDKDTKRARMAEHDEIAAAKAAASARAAASGKAGGGAATFQTVPDAMLHGQPINARFGARGHRTDEKRMSFTVINRNPDGTWSTQCLAGETAAQHAMHSKPMGGANDR
jgi:hypothetical protein